VTTAAIGACLSAVHATPGTLADPVNPVEPAGQALLATLLASLPDEDFGSIH
jgi:hypothetical protein